MTDEKVTISRRKILAGLSAVGAAGAGAGLGTSALFGDSETFEGNTVAAGSLDLEVDWAEQYFDGLRNLGDDCEADVRLLGDGESPDATEVGFPATDDPLVAVAEDDVAAFLDCTSVDEFDGMGDDPPSGVIELNDVKPGDFGEITLCYGIRDNPGYVQLRSEVVADAENAIVEPETGVDDTPEDGELGDAIRAVAWYDPTGDVRPSDAGDAVFVEEGSLNDVLATTEAMLYPAAAGGSPGWDVGERCHVPGLDCAETLYLSDTGDDGESVEGQTRLFSVDLHDDTDDGPVAVLDELPASPLGSNFTQSDAIAATPYVPDHPGSPIGPADSNGIYVVDRESAHLGRYDLEDDSFEDLGEIDGISPGDQIVLLSFDPEGRLWAVGQSSGDTVFEFTDIDENPAADAVTSVKGVDVEGADIAYDSNGELYLYSSDDGRLYTVDRSSGDATLVGTVQDDKGRFTGLAVRNAGTGDIVGSNEEDNAIYVLDKITGSEGTDYEMRLADGDGFEAGEYSYGYGDMTVNQLCPEYCIALAWWVPRDTGNEIQSDRVEFDLTLETEQCRNNDDPF